MDLKPASFLSIVQTKRELSFGGSESNESPGGGAGGCEVATLHRMSVEMRDAETQSGSQEDNV